jgi:hypothetical protein
VSLDSEPDTEVNDHKLETIATHANCSIATVEKGISSSGWYLLPLSLGS